MPSEPLDFVKTHVLHPVSLFHVCPFETLKQGGWEFGPILEAEFIVELRGAAK